MPWNAVRPETRFFWFNGLAQLATCAVSPLVSNWQFKRSGLSKAERKPLVLQDTVRQGLSAMVLLTTYFGGAWVAGKFLGRHTGAAKSYRQQVAGVALSFLGYALIRPMISSEIVARLLRQDQALAGPAKTQNASVRQAVQRRGFEGYLQRTQPLQPLPALRV